MVEPLIDFDAVIYDEMMVHPVLFTHPKASKIALLCDKASQMPEEILKHAQIKELCLVSNGKEIYDASDARLVQHTGDVSHWLNTATSDSWDIIIAATPLLPAALTACLHLLKKDGILVAECDSLFALDNFKRLYQSLKDSGFDDLHVLHFPQPTQPLGSCTAILANRQGAFKRIREKDIFNKAFTTRYYNFDMHRAAMALPPFTRDALALET